MNTNMVKSSLIKQPSAYLLLALSLAALVLVLSHAVVFGVVHAADEGAAAHIWQILALLVGTWLANFAAVYWLT
jgi:hypothetical protein